MNPKLLLFIYFVQMKGEREIQRGRLISSHLRCGNKTQKKLLSELFCTFNTFLLNIIVTFYETRCEASASHVSLNYR